MSVPSYDGQVAHVEHIQPREPAYGDLDRPLPAVLRDRLHALGIDSLYSHQARAINLIRAGNNVMIATPSASGKTLCYNLPVVESLLEHRKGRALYLFPTKALAQDQRRALLELIGDVVPEMGIDSFDGDTPYEVRGEIRSRSRVVMTNPDMLHLGILPNHRAWARFLSNLRYVVVDEAHAYRGIFGSHVANVLRRLRRLCSFYGSRPQFISCSATIANTGGHI
jgi:DEAD/DEAH box helicase domain-containing protein